MTETLLDGTDNTPDNTNSQPSADYIASRVGPDKQFKTVEELMHYKDGYINTLTSQLDEMRKDYLKMNEENATRAKLEEIVGRLESRQPQQPSNSNQPPANDVGNAPVIDPKELDSLISNKVQEIETKKKQDENFKRVKDRLTEQFGNNYQSVLKQHMDQLGLSEEFVNNLAKTNPEFLLKSLGVTAKPANLFQAPPASNVRTDGFKPTASTERTWSWYQNLKRTDPKRYFDPKTNVEMHNDAQRLGDAFKDGDYAMFGDI
jgi:hypothetical protein